MLVRSKSSQQLHQVNYPAVNSRAEDVKQVVPPLGLPRTISGGLADLRKGLPGVPLSTLVLGGSTSGVVARLELGQIAAADAKEMEPGSPLSASDDYVPPVVADIDLKKEKQYEQLLERAVIQANQYQKRSLLPRGNIFNIAEQYLLAEGFSESRANHIINKVYDKFMCAQRVANFHKQREVNCVLNSGVYQSRQWFFAVRKESVSSIMGASVVRKKQIF
jgi:hypothetical protein